MDDLTSSSWNSGESYYFKRSIPDSKQWARRDLWSRLFRPDHRLTTYSPESPAASGSGYLTSVSRVRLIPYDKRGIPIELQKALYAHGIVGRRRWRVVFDKKRWLVVNTALLALLWSINGNEIILSTDLWDRREAFDSLKEFIKDGSYALHFVSPRHQRFRCTDHRVSSLKDRQSFCSFLLFPWIERW